MARGRGSERRTAGARGRGAHETQDCPYLLRHRRQTRSSRGVSPRLINIPPSGRVNRNPRILQRERETAEAECSHGYSQPAGREPVIENIVEDGAPPTSTASPSYCGPSTKKEMDLDGLCAELTSRVEGQHQDVDDDVQPPTPRENFVGPSLSFNMTEFVRGLEDDSVDEQHEVESAPGVGYDDVHGHKVKIELAGLVGAIFGRYGDITAECNAKSPPFLSFFLERLCVFYQTLEESKLSELTREQINGMLDELHLFETHKLNVKWLLERLELISETKSKKYLAVKEEAEKHIKCNSRIDEDLKQRRKHIDLLQMNISALEREKEENEATLSALEKKRVENQAKADECTQMAIDMKTRGQALANQSLVHSLL